MHLLFEKKKVRAMKNFISICIFWSVFFPYFSVEGKEKEMNKLLSDTLPASQRIGKITANWFDRATFEGYGVKPQGENILWYTRSARVWEEALPIGNGRLGGMIFGGVADERIQLNESTLWDGYSYDRNNPQALQALPEVQRLLFENKNNEAVKLASQTMMGIPERIRPYQSLGELWFGTPVKEAEGYIRCLDLSTALVTTTYHSNGVNYRREYFASAIDNIIVLRFTADRKNKINCTFTLRRAENARCGGIASDPYSLLLEGQLPVKDKEGNARGISFAAQIKPLIEDGSVKVSDGTLIVENASSLTLYVAGATNYPGLSSLANGITNFSANPVQTCQALINKAVSKPYDKLKGDHIADYQKYYSRVAIELGERDNKIEDLPTDERLMLAKKRGEPDLGLIEDYFQFGRYLLISCSRPGGMPANLQGLWAWQMNPPWSSDFHTNINFQMNYWPVEVTNLSELHTPMFDLMDVMVRYGKETAKTMYGAKGWVVHHLTDAWGFTAPADGPQGIWPVGGAWLAQHPWEHYCFTGDKIFLEKRAYPIMKGAALFIMDFLVKAPRGTAYAGKLVTNPSYSPENEFYLPDGTKSVFTYGATMDLEIIHNLLTNCIQACNILNVDKRFKKECEKTLSQLPPIRISEKTGRILEWAEDYKEVDPHHRHTSHLFGLHPGNQITVGGTPELAEAARKTLLARGDGGTGWGLAWKINMWNRLQDGDHAYKLLSVLLSTKTYPNMFDAHPPFQIDGNFGATAAIAEMFVQSHLVTKNGSFEIHLLPALPTCMRKKGKIKGFCARGGFIVNMTWENGQLKNAQIYSVQGGELHLHTGNYYKTYKTKKGETIKIDATLQKI